MMKLTFVLAFLTALPCAGHGQTTAQPPQASVDKSPSPELAKAASLTEQALSMHRQNLYDGALLLAKQALELREKALGPDHELIATSLNNVAAIYVAKNLYADAEGLYRRSLKILEQRFGVDSKYLTDTIEQVAWMRFAHRNNSEAEKLFSRALAIKENQVGPDRLETAQTLSTFGAFYERINKFDKAADCFKRSVAIRENLLGPKHLDLLEALDDCACVLLQNNRTDEGKQYQSRATAIRNLIASDPINQQGGVLQGKAILRVDPRYPVGAYVRGTVVVEVTVDECGIVIDARALSGPIDSRDAAVTAARRWRFTITKLGSRRVKVTGTIKFNFL